MEAADQKAVAQDLDGADACPSSRQIKNMYKRQNSDWMEGGAMCNYSLVTVSFPKKRENASDDKEESYQK